MNVQSMMDLLGSQQAAKTAKVSSSKTKSSASSSDLFSSIIGQKKDTQQNVTNLASGQAAKTSAKDGAQSASAASKDAQSASKDAAGAAQDAAAGDVQNADIVDENIQDTAAGNEAAGDTAVAEDTEASEEPIIEEEEADGDAPQKIILSMQQMPVEAPMIAPVIITQDTQVSPEAPIVNDVSLNEIPVQTTTEQMPVENGQTVTQPTEQPADAAFSEFMPVTEEGADQAAVEVTDALKNMPKMETKVQPQQTVQEQVNAEEVPAEEIPVKQAETQALETDKHTEHAQSKQTAVHTDAAEEFAAQVVDEAKNMVKEPVQATSEEPLMEEEPLVKAEAAADTDENMDDASDNKSQSDTKSMTQQPAAAQVTEDGRVNFKMTAAQPLEAEQYIQPETRQMIMNRVVDQVRTAVTPDKTEFYLQLKPDYLGGLSIALASEDKGIVAKIMTSSQQVHNALQADMTALQQVLRDRGINVVQMEVIYDQMANSTMKDNSDNRGQQFSQGNSNRSHGRISDQNEEALTMYDTLSSYEVLAENGGSVEFSA